MQARKFHSQDKDVQEYTFTINFSLNNNKINEKIWYPLFYNKDMTLRN